MTAGRQAHGRHGTVLVEPADTALTGEGPDAASVLELVRTGHTTKDIAAQLGISTSTVLWHRKLALARQTAAAAPERSSGTPKAAIRR